MAVSFNNIPSTIRVPLFYAEVDNSAANTQKALKKSLIIAPINADGSAEEGQVTLVPTTSQAKTLFGRGSVASLMVEAYRNQDTAGVLWVLPIGITESTQATGSLAVTGTALESGTISLYVGGVKVPVVVTKGQQATAVITAIVSVINQKKDLPISATAGDGVVNLTSKVPGVYGNDIVLGLNRQGAVGGEANVDGITVEITALSGGAGAIDYAEAFQKVESEAYQYIIIPDCDADSLNACKTEMNDSTGRWSYVRMQYGHVWSCKRGTAQNLVTFGNTRNDQHATVFGIESNNPNISWVVAGAVGGRASAFYNADPARPLQTGVLNGLLAPKVADRFGFNEQNTLLQNGIATLYVNADTVMIQRAITTYQTNSFGDADNSYLDSTTLYTLAEIITTLKGVITSKYPRHKLASDGTRFGAGQAIVTPSVIRSELIAQYAYMEEKGLVENADLFAKYLIVERNVDDPCRVDVLLPPDLVNQLRIFAMLNQFRLQYGSND